MIAVGTGTDAVMEGDGTRVLVVDDDQDTADLFGGILLGRGYAVVVAHDGASALAEIARFEPHIALLDLGLPAMDGYELARRLRATCPHVRIAAITGYGQAADREQTRRQGFDVHLLKPVGMFVLLDTVAALRSRG